MANDFDPYYRWLGIPAEEQPPDHYRLLGIRRFEADPEVISNASDQRMSHLRTFAHGQRAAESQRLLNEVSAATRTLLDEPKRKEYDAQLHARIAAKEAKAQARAALPVAQAIPLPAASHTPAAPPAAPPTPHPAASFPIAAPVEIAADPAGAGRRPLPRRKSGIGAGIGIAIAMAVLLIAGMAGGAYYAWRSMQQDEPIAENPGPTNDTTPKETTPKETTPNGTKPKEINPKENGRKEVTPVDTDTTPKVEPGENPPPAIANDQRSIFFYPDHQGKSGFIRQAGSKWQEIHGNRLKFTLEERTRTPEYVELALGDGQGLKLRLFSDHVEAMFNGKDFTRQQSGKWVAASELASLLKETRAAESRTVWFYPQAPDGKSRGVYRKVDDRRWEQTETSGQAWQFEAREATPEYVALHETKAGTDLRLYADRVEFRRGTEWIRAQRGGWIKESQLASLMKMEGPSTGPPAQSHESVSSLVFSGIGSSARVSSDRSLLDIDDSFSVDFWFRRTSDLDGSIGLVALGQMNVSLVVRERNGMAEQFCELYAEKWKRTPVNVPPDRQWHHFAVNGGGGRVFVYLDGKQVSVAGYSELSVRELNPVQFGAARAEEGEVHFEGEMQSVRLAEKSLFPEGRPFETPKPQGSQLPDGTSLVLSSGVKEMKPQSTGMPPRTLADLAKPNTGGQSNGEDAPAQKREPLPSSDAVKTAQAKINDVYGARIKAAQKPDDKIRLAREILTAATTDPDNVTAYALLLEARRVGLLGFDVSLGLEVVAEVVRRFDVNREEQIADLLEDAAPRSLPPAQRELLVQEAMSSAMTALREEKIPVADRLAVVATSSASKGKDADLKKSTRLLLEHVKLVKSAWEAKEDAEKKLAETPDDPAANIAVGRYYAFALGDFTKGAEYMAKSSDASVSDAGKKELAAKDAESRFAAAEAWYRLVEKLKGAEKLMVQRHVLTECQDLASTLPGLAKAQAEIRIKELQPIVAEADKANPLNIKPSKLAPGLIVRLLSGSNRTPTPYLLVAQSEGDIYNHYGEIIGLLRPYPSTSPRYAMQGFLVVEADTNVYFQFDNCSGKIGSQVIHAPYGDPVNLTVRMSKGTYPVALLTTYSSHRFSVTDSNTGRSLLAHDERALETELQKSLPVPVGGAMKSQRIDAGGIRNNAVPNNNNFGGGVNPGPSPNRPAPRIDLSPRPSQPAPKASPAPSVVVE